MSHYVTLPEIKLKRTDTTLDLSQKAKRAEEEKKKKKFRVSTERPSAFMGCRMRSVAAELADFSGWAGTNPMRAPKVTPILSQTSLKNIQFRLRRSALRDLADKRRKLSASIICSNP